MWFVITIVLTGCTSSRQYIPKEANNNSTNTVSVTHPYQNELRQKELDREGLGKRITQTSFEVLVDPGMLNEGAGFGVYPVPARKPNGEMLQGYVLVVPDREGNLPMTPSCDVLGKVFFEATVEELSKAKILVAQNDFGWLYTLDGKEVPIPGKEKVEGMVYYDPKEYDSNEDYKKGFFETWGKTLVENRDLWRQYYAKHDAMFRDNVFSIEVGSEGWEQYRAEILKIMPKVYKMPMGEYRIGYLSTDEFRNSSAELADSNVALKVFKGFGLDLGMLAASFSGIGAVIPAVGFAGQVTSAAIDTNQYQKFSSRAFAQRHDFAPLLRLMARSCQNKKNQNK